MNCPDEEMAKEYDVIILFLDELNGARPATQAAAYRWFLILLLANTSVRTML